MLQQPTYSSLPNVMFFESKCTWNNIVTTAILCEVLLYAEFSIWLQQNWYQNSCKA